MALVRGNGSYWTSGSLAKCPFAAEYGRIKQGDSRTYPPTGGIWHPAAKLTSAKYEVEPRSSLPEQKLRNGDEGNKISIILTTTRDYKTIIFRVFAHGLKAHVQGERKLDQRYHSNQDTHELYEDGSEKYWYDYGRSVKPSLQPWYLYCNAKCHQARVTATWSPGGYSIGFANVLCNGKQNAIQDPFLYPWKGWPKDDADKLVVSHRFGRLGHRSLKPAVLRLIGNTVACPAGWRAKYGGMYISAIRR
ncbi:hypothetical protein CISG_05876 [Coccidioides immitis RMSCC 3703]|uniref:Uncharacterized protein n=2 Tax=Coccidioides immitis TaxID=5501 RepID=A0A0J8QZC2_COCIT|nr:hypothetical protein CIRG_10286 [Coccidioides immitis RMSCC 2394]KMU76733.1 hypothetical protein CISG_05876 [Coccidioides immitis RMSCC 3703]